MPFDTLATDASIEKTVAALKANGINAEVVNTGAEAKDWVLKTVPQGAEVMTMTSITLDTIGLEKELNESGKFDSVKSKLAKMNRETQSSEMQKLGAAPTWTVGSVHAVTENGEVMIASNTGSQLPAYAYGAQHVIWVVGTQKITPNLDEAHKRLHEYVVPLEAVRARKAYGIPENMPGTNVSKLLVISREISPGRITVVFVKEKLGF